jgi:hypothetical protein
VAVVNDGNEVLARVDRLGVVRFSEFYDADGNELTAAG